MNDVGRRGPPTGPAPPIPHDQEIPVKLIDLNQSLAETNTELDRIRDEIAKLPGLPTRQPAAPGSV